MQEWREEDEEEDQGSDGWMDDVQEDIASLGVRNWKTMASDRVQWRTVVGEAKVHFGP